MTNKNTMMLAIALIVSSIFISIGLATGGKGVYSFSRDKRNIFRYNNFTGNISLCRVKNECVDIRGW